MICKICGSSTHKAFNARVLAKHDVDFFCCDTCGLLFTPNPHWLDEAYSSAIAAADTGLIARNVQVSNKVACILHWCGLDQVAAKYVDIAGGYGMLTRLMRDLGFDFYWSDKYCANELAKGFEYVAGQQACTAVTAIEVLEHLTEPLQFIEESLSSVGADSIIFTTELYAGPPPSPAEWWYYTFETGQHISFYQHRTLEFIAKKLGLQFSTAHGIHVLSRKPISAISLWLATHPTISRFGAIWTRRRKGSKTVADHKQMLERALQASSSKP